MLSYSKQIIDHFTNPRNLRVLEHADVTAKVVHPCCGDRLHFYARVLADRIKECTFLAYGCAASIAIGSLLAEAITARQIDDLACLDEDWVAELAGGLNPDQRHSATLGKDVLQSLVHNYRAARSEGGMP
jgi:nitrogen fixation NifU-like protein